MVRLKQLHPPVENSNCSCKLTCGPPWCRRPPGAELEPENQPQQQQPPPPQQQQQAKPKKKEQKKQQQPPQGQQQQQQLPGPQKPDSKWWRHLTDTDPISLEPLCKLKVAYSCNPC